jgi:hypothetical protein
VKNRSSSTLPILLVVPGSLTQDQTALNASLAQWYRAYFGQPWQEQNPNLITINEDQEGIKIDAVRKLQDLLSYSVGLAQHRIVIMYGFESTQPVAQNAMLKILEEPPDNTQFILITRNLSQTLPTVKSRCVVAYLDNAGTNASEGLPYQPVDLLHKITTNKIGELLALSDEFSDRQDAIHMLEALAFYLHAQLSTKPTPGLTSQVTAIQLCINDLKANVNVKLALDHCWMKLKSAIQH